MANSLSVSTVIEKNKIASSIPFLVLLEIDVINPANNLLVETLYVVNNTSDVTLQGRVYLAYPFSVDITEAEGSLSEIQLSIEDVARTIQGRMQAYGGGVGFDVRVLIVNSAELNQTPDVSETFTITAANASDYVVHFTLGIENPLAMRFPKRKYFRNDGFPAINTSTIRY